VANAREALEQLHAAERAGQPIEGILIDWQMPGIDGLSLANTIRTNPRLHETRVVMMATMARHLWDDELRSAEVAAFVSKPLLYSQLFECLRTLKGGAAVEPETTLRALPSPRRRPDGKMIRLLLAEDNPVNQAVTVRQLERLGYACDSVSNGREALQALRQIAYDVVLMDLQMPEMDGYQATTDIRRREARRLEGPPGQAAAHKRTCIIAMTAHALKEDREKCLSAGMDDYISKPVRPAELAAVLDRWLFGAEPASVVAAVPAVAHASIDVTQFMATLGLEGADAGPLLELYVQSTSKNLEELAQAAAKKEAAVLERVAHSAAGANAMVGMNAMARLLRHLELDAKQGKLQEAPAVLAQLNVEFEAIKAYLAAHPNQAQSSDEAVA
jgi:two-component system, sensor histidine kinase and response regulator